MNNSPRWPQPLRRGDNVRVISPGLPSMAYVPQRVRRGAEALAGAGFSVSYGANAFKVSDDGVLAGEVWERANDINDAFADPQVSAIICSDAGLGSRELTPLLDVDTIRSNPKAFVGYCDNVYVNQFLLHECDLISFYGSVFMVHLGEVGGPFRLTLDTLVAGLTQQPYTFRAAEARTREWFNWYISSEEGRQRSLDTPGGWTWLVPGTATGRLLGSELSALPTLVRDFGLDVSGSVLFFHVAPSASNVEAMVVELADKVDLSRVAALMVGTHPTLHPDEWAGRLKEILPALKLRSATPVVVNAEVTHSSPAWTVPYGATVMLEGSALTVIY